MGQGGSSTYHHVRNVAHMGAHMGAYMGANVARVTGRYFLQSSSSRHWRELYKKDEADDKLKRGGCAYS